MGYKMPEINRTRLLEILRNLNLGKSVAEVDDILYEARVETGAFWDLHGDKVDLIPGTKGSGKSTLFQLFVKYLKPVFLKQRKVLLAHGIETHGDHVFRIFTDKFSRLTEGQFQTFWYIYFVSLINEALLKSREYRDYLKDCGSEIREFQQRCARKNPGNQGTPINERHYRVGN